MDFVWIVDQYREGTFERQGVFSTKEKAIAACRNRNYVVVRFRLDEELADENIGDYPYQWYPLAEPEPVEVEATVGV